jgi:hypothetical protein
MSKDTFTRDELRAGLIDMFGERGGSVFDKLMPPPLQCDLCDATAADVEAAIDAGWLPSYYDGPEPDGEETGNPICEACVNKCHLDNGEYTLNAEYRDIPLPDMLTALSKELSDLDGDSVSVEVNQWYQRHINSPPSHDKMEYRLWSARMGKSFIGNDFREAAGKFRKAVADRKASEAIPSVTAATSAQPVAAAKE